MPSLNTYHLTWVSFTLDEGYLLTATLPDLGHGVPPLPTTQEKTLYMDITRWSTLKSDYILCSHRWRSSTQSAKTRPGTDCGSDHELLIAKFKLKLKKVGKTTSSLTYDPNQTSYDSVKVTDLRD